MVLILRNHYFISNCIAFGNWVGQTRLLTLSLMKLSIKLFSIWETDRFRGYGPGSSQRYPWCMVSNTCLVTSQRGDTEAEALLRNICALLPGGGGYIRISAGRYSTVLYCMSCSSRPDPGAGDDAQGIPKSSVRVFTLTPGGSWPGVHRDLTKSMAMFKHSNGGHLNSIRCTPVKYLWAQPPQIIQQTHHHI